MEERDRVHILDEILSERMPFVRHTLNEWSVPQADPFNHAQAKDLIWQLSGPLGLSMLGFSAAERALAEEPANPDLIEARERFARIGEETGQLLEQVLIASGGTRR